MSEREPPCDGTSRPAELHRDVDEALFEAWRTGDEAARTEAWRRLFVKVTSWAVPFCRPFAPDDHTARSWASDAIHRAYAEIDQKVRSRTFYWAGAPQFAGMFANRVTQRCRDRWRRDPFGAARGKLVSLEAGADPIVAPPTPGHEAEADALAVARTRTAVDDIVCRLALRRELCSGRTTLVDVIDAELAYVRECCVRAIAGVDTSTLTLDQLVPLLQRDEFSASAEEMNTFIMKQLNIRRVTLDQRRLRIRKLLDRAVGDGPDRPPTLGAL